MAGINLDYSRRTMPNRCCWWSRDESGVGNSDEYIYLQEPRGYFYAKATTPERETMNVVQNTYMSPKITVVIESNDDLGDIAINDLVRYKGKIWRINNSPQRILRENKNMMSDREEYKYLLSLER